MCAIITTITTIARTTETTITIATINVSMRGSVLRRGACHVCVCVCVKGVKCYTKLGEGERGERSRATVSGWGALKSITMKSLYSYLFGSLDARDKCATRGRCQVAAGGKRCAVG